MKTNINNTKLTLAGLCMAALLISGCANFPGFGNSGSTDETYAYSEPVSDYYYGDFEDVPIPREMSANKEGYVVYTQGNVKIGLQVFTGRVEITSLNRAVVEYMSRDGWTLYSGSHGPKQNMLVFNKGDRLCVIVTIDGTMQTEMRVNVTQKI